jgi:hypothetical protein
MIGHRSEPATRDWAAARAMGREPRVWAAADKGGPSLLGETARPSASGGAGVSLR